MTFAVLAMMLNNFYMFIEFRTVKNTWSQKLKFLHCFVTNSFR